MAKQMKRRQVPTLKYLVKSWKELLQEAAPGQERINAMFQISKDLQLALRDYERGAIDEAFRDVIFDNSERKGYFRLAGAFTERQQKRMAKHEGKGMSASHALILARVADPKRRGDLLKQSMDEGWTRDVLRTKVPGTSERQATARPRVASKKIGAAVNNLISALQEFDGLDGDAHKAVKPKEKAATAEEMEAVSKLLVPREPIGVA